MKAKRIQRKRTRGWKMPLETVYVGRPSMWGNPMKVADGFIYIDASHRRRVLDKWVILCEGGTDKMLVIYEAILTGDYKTLESLGIFDLTDVQLWMYRLWFQFVDNGHELRWKNLACWCREGEPCHADVLLKIVNQ